MQDMIDKQPARKCLYEEDATKCPKYTKSQYKTATYCIYATWEGSCFNIDMEENAR